MTERDDSAAKALISKSQRKRDLVLVFELATQLVARAPTELDRLPLDAQLREAIDLARETRQHGAHKRQLKRVAGLLREGDLAAVEAAVAGLTKPPPGARARGRSFGEPQPGLRRRGRLKEVRHRLAERLVPLGVAGAGRLRSGVGDRPDQGDRTGVG